MFDEIAIGYIARRGWHISEDGRLVIARKDAHELGTSIAKPELKTVAIPTMYGLTLYFEGKHFTIE